MRECFIIGITGGSGSGKTQFLKELVKHFDPGLVTRFSMDNYYKPLSEQWADENGVVNFDLPEAIDADLFYADLLKLRAGEDLTIPEYNFNHLHEKSKDINIPTAPVIIVEGIYTMHYPAVRSLLNLKLFVESAEHLMLKRRIIRDAQERGYDLDDVLYRYEFHVMPAYEKFILPHRQHVDLIIPNYENFDVALKVIESHIEHLLK